MSNRFHNKFHRHNHHTEETDRGTNYPDSAYDPIASRQSPFKGEFYSEGDITTTDNLCAEGNLSTGGDLDVKGKTEILGNLSVWGEIVTLDSRVTITSSLSITNTENIYNYPTLDIKNNSSSVFHIKGNTGDGYGGYVGVGTASPNEKFTVSGNISASGDIKASGNLRISSIFCDGEPSSNRWNSTYTTVCTTSSNWEAAYQSINDINNTLTEFKNLSGAINTLNQKFSSSVFTVNTETSTVNITKHLSVSNNLSVGAEFFFGSFKVIETTFAMADNQTLSIPSPANDIVVIGSDDFSGTASVSALSFTGGAKRGAFYVLTNEMGNGTVLEFSPTEKIHLRGGANTLSLNLSTGDSCCVRCKDNTGIVTIW